MTGEYFDNIFNNVETYINKLENGFLKNNKNMSDIYFWMNNDKSIIIDLSHIIGVVKLDNPTRCSNRICEYGVYTSIGKDAIFLITQKEHLSLIEALQETYGYCEMEEDENTEDEETNEIYNTSIGSNETLFNDRVKWVL